jgi:uncharacterized protein YifN (PemK superfamily)
LHLLAGNLNRIRAIIRFVFCDQETARNYEEQPESWIFSDPRIKYAKKDFCKVPHAFHVYRNLKGIGFSDEQAAAIGTVIEQGDDPGRLFVSEAVQDILFEAGMKEIEAEIYARVLQNCFASEKRTLFFDQVKLKRDLVRSGIIAARATEFLEFIDPCVVTMRTREIRAPVRYAPGAGKVVMCDFTHLMRPEMVKERRAIVLSRNSSSKRTCIVVPVSKSRPRGEGTSFVEFSPGAYSCFHTTEPVWAVCDHVYTVALTRLWQVNIQQKPQMPSLSTDHLEEIRSRVRAVLA